MGAPTSVEEKWRSWIGWLDSWPHKVQQDAVRGDWVIDPNAVLKAGRLVVLVAGFVVAAYAVTGIESQYLDEAANRRRARFIVKDDEVIAAPFVNRRWRLSRGWTVSLINGQPTKELVTITEAARMLGLSRPTLMKHIESGEISHVNVGTHHRVPAEAVLEFQRTRKARRGKAAEALAEFSNEIGFVE